ncbi:MULTISPECIES: DUF3526 domain-containing protein [unclassified Schlesneria]|uniref:DUF3526 domain-containing protein n=1 Tax=unclassified Schlesneria TaxID=2762017 RepID=UPI002F1F5BB9
MKVFAGITTELRREWHLAVSDPAVPATLGVAAVLTLLALLSGMLRTQERWERQQILEQENVQQRAFLESAFDDDSTSNRELSGLTQAQQDRRSELQMSARSADLLRFTGGHWRAMLPPSVLAGLSTGASGEWPDHYDHAGSSITATVSRTMRTSPILAAVGTFDLTLLIGAILPLAVIGLTFNVVAVDRELGRWDLIRSQATSTFRLVVIRSLIRVTAIALVVFLLTVSWILIAPVGDVDLVAIRNIALWGGWLFVYLAFWGALAILVSSFKLSSSGSGLLLLLCWYVLVLAVPSAVEHAINTRFPLPRASDLIAMEADVRKQLEQDVDVVWAEFLQRHPGITLDEDDPQREFVLRDLALIKAIRSEAHQRTEEYFLRFRQREEQLDLCQMLSPLLAWRTAADQCAGTSLRHFLGLARETAAFHDHYLSHFETLSLEGRELMLTDMRELPRFQVKNLPSQLDQAPLLLSATSLLLWTAMGGWTNWQMMQRSDRH